MSYDSILGFLAQFSLLAWIIVAISCFLVLRATGSKGWLFIMFGSLFVASRQMWKFFPDYKIDQVSDAIINMYMLRYVLGWLGALLLSIGFIMLIVNYYVVKTRMES